MGESECQLHFDDLPTYRLTELLGSVMDIRQAVRRTRGARAELYLHVLDVLAVCIGIELDMRSVSEHTTETGESRGLDAATEPQHTSAPPVKGEEGVPRETPGPAMVPGGSRSGAWPGGLGGSEGAGPARTATARGPSVVTAHPEGGAVTVGVRESDIEAKARAERVRLKKLRVDREKRIRTFPRRRFGGRR